MDIDGPWLGKRKTTTMTTTAAGANCDGANTIECSTQQLQHGLDGGRNLSLVGSKDQQQY